MNILAKIIMNDSVKVNYNMKETELSSGGCIRKKTTPSSPFAFNSLRLATPQIMINKVRIEFSRTSIVIVNAIQGQ